MVEPEKKHGETRKTICYERLFLHIILKVPFHSERYINCTCSLDLIEKVSQESLFRVLRERLPLLEVLDKVIVFNYERFGSCADIVLSHEDLKQWKVIWKS